MKLKRAALISFLPILVAGCGGGSSSISNPGGAQTASVGEARITYSGSAKPLVQTQESGLSVTSFAGASISSLAIDPVQTDVNTAIGYSTNVLGLDTYQNGVIQIVLNGFNIGAYCSKFGHDGHIYYADAHTDATFHIEKAYYDGSSPTTIYNNPTNNATVNLDISPNGATIAMQLFMGGVYTITSSGTNLTLLDTAGSEPAISPDSTKVAYVKTVGSYTQIVYQPIGGGAITQVTTDSNNHYFPVWSIDGGLILCDIDNGTSRVIGSYIASGADMGGSFTSNYTGSVPWSSHASFSPDGKYIVCEQASAYSTNPASQNVVALTAGGDSAQTIATDCTGAAWSPFFANRSFVGASAYFFTSAAGFLLTEYQTGFDSLLAFQATTPSKATAKLVSQPTTGGTGPLVYDVHADTVTSIKYVNTYYSNPITVSPNTSDALVSIDATTGLLTSVAPYVEVRGASLQHQTGSLQYRANFTGVYDGHGKNLAPGGASTITFDPKHSAVQSVG